jgi:hypothetical protein
MTETMMIGVGKPVERPSLKTWAKDKIRTSFTFAGAEEKWREKHAKEIQELQTINASLSDEDRVKAAEKLEKSIKTAAKVKVVGNYGAAVLVTTAVVGEGLLIGNYKGWADTLADNKNFKYVGKQAQGIKRGLENIILKIFYPNYRGEL